MDMILSEAEPKFGEMKRLYSRYFSLGYISGNTKRSPIENRLVLICLLCFVYNKNKPKNPDLTYYELISKLNKNLGLPDNFIKSLSIICEDFGYECSDFPTFGLKGQDILKEIVEILKTYIPF